MDAKDAVEKLDKIYITDLLLRCIIGINDTERTHKQDVLINITLYADLSRPCKTDRIEDSIDYKQIKKQVITLVETSSFYLSSGLRTALPRYVLPILSLRPFVQGLTSPELSDTQRASVSKFSGYIMMAETLHTQLLVGAFVAVGSNIDPQNNITLALLALKKYTAITDVSNFYQTKAVGHCGQPDFLNGVIRILTYRSPRTLKFEVLRTIEARFGRIRSADKFAARTIDLDVILYDKLVNDELDLRLPDPAIRTYPFVAVPLLKLAPDLILPDTDTPLWTEHAANLKADLHPQTEFTNRLRGLVLA